MENKEPISSNPQGVCEKFFNALSVTPTFKTLRRISHHPQTVSAPSAPAPAPTPTPPSPPVPVSTNPVQNKPSMRLEPTHKVSSKVSEAVVPKTDPPLPLTTKSFKEKLPTPPVQPVQEKKEVAKVNLKLDPTPPKVSVQQEIGKPSTEVHSTPPVKAVPEDGKAKVVKKAEPPQSPPKVVAEKADGKKIRTSINDKASDYINRARNKIRTTSSVGGGGKVSTPK